MIKFERHDVIEYLLTVFQSVVALMISFISLMYGIYLASDWQVYSSDFKEGTLYMLASLVLTVFNILYIVCIIRVSSRKTNILIKYELRAIHSALYVIECSLVIIVLIILQMPYIIAYIPIGAILLTEIHMFNKNIDRLRSKLSLNKE